MLSFNPSQRSSAFEIFYKLINAHLFQINNKE